MHDPSEETIGSLVRRLEQRGVMLALRAGKVIATGAAKDDASGIEALRARRPEIAAYLEGKVAVGSGVQESILIDQDEAPPFRSVKDQGFDAMLDLSRFVDRSALFDRMISASGNHYWDPLDPRYLDFSSEFDVQTQPILSEEGFVCLQTPTVRTRLPDAGERARFINRVAWMQFSSVLHGEQGALSLTASLCGLLKDQGAQEFCATQVREEARHVTGFARYIKARWGRPAPCPPVLRRFLNEIVASDDVTKKIVGMQVIVEGLAMGTLGALHRTLVDPLGRRLVQLVMTDESFHHKFGKLWAEETMPQLGSTERARLQRWTGHCLRDFIVKMNMPVELQLLQSEYGVEIKQVVQEVQSLPEEARLRFSQAGPPETFRVLANTLLGAGLLDDQAKQLFSSYLSTDAMVPILERQQDIVEDGLAYLRSVNGEAS